MRQANKCAKNEYKHGRLSEQSNQHKHKANVFLQQHLFGDFLFAYSPIQIRVWS